MSILIVFARVETTRKMAKDYKPVLSPKDLWLVEMAMELEKGQLDAFNIELEEGLDRGWCTPKSTHGLDKRHYSRLLKAMPGLASEYSEAQSLLAGIGSLIFDYKKPYKSAPQYGVARELIAAQESLWLRRKERRGAFRESDLIAALTHATSTKSYDLNKMFGGLDWEIQPNDMFTKAFIGFLTPGGSVIPKHNYEDIIRLIPWLVLMVQWGFETPPPAMAPNPLTRWLSGQAVGLYDGEPPVAFATKVAVALVLCNSLVSTRRWIKNVYSNSRGVNEVAASRYRRRSRPDRDQELSEEEEAVLTGVENIKDFRDLDKYLKNKTPVLVSNKIDFSNFIARIVRETL